MNNQAGFNSGCWRRSPDVVRRVVAGEVLLIPVKGRIADLQRIYVLDAVGDCIWGLLDGARSVGDVRDGVCAAFAVDAETAERDAVELIGKLSAAGLVCGEGGGVVSMPDGTDGPA